MNNNLDQLLKKLEGKRILRAFCEKPTTCIIKCTDGTAIEIYVDNDEFTMSHIEGCMISS